MTKTDIEKLNLLRLEIHKQQERRDQLVERIRLRVGELVAQCSALESSCDHAQFQNLCEQVALEEYWSDLKVSRSENPESNNTHCLTASQHNV